MALPLIVLANVSPQVHVGVLLLRPPPPPPADHADRRPPPPAPLPPQQALLVHRVPARPARHHPLAPSLLQLVQADGAGRPVLNVDLLGQPRPVGPRPRPRPEEVPVEPLPEAGPRHRVGRRRRGEEPLELARPEGPPLQAGVVEGDPEHADEDEQYVLARGRAVGARARGAGRQRHGVHVPRRAEDEEGGLGAVEEQEVVADGPDDPVHGRLGRPKELARRMMAAAGPGRRVGGDGLHWDLIGKRAKRRSWRLKKGAKGETGKRLVGGFVGAFWRS